MRDIVPNHPLTTLYAAAVMLLITACSTPSGSGGRSEYGDRPGPKGFSTVVIDAGHGGKDSGAKARGQQEKTLVLDIAKRLRSELQPGYRVVMVRDGDYFVDLNDRVKKANRYGGAVLVSIHLNHGPSRLGGVETYYWRTDSYSLAKRLHRHLQAATSVKSGNRGMVRRRLRLTRNPQIPGVLLECGYLTNSRESALLGTAAYREKLAKAIARGIREQSREGDAGMGPLPKPIYMPRSKASDARDRP